MKKKMIITFVFILFTSFPFLLVSDIGIKGGINHTRFYFEPGDFEAWGPSFRYQVGGFFKIHLSQLLKLQPELIFVRKSGTAEKPFLNGNIEQSHGFSYIQLPVSFVFSFPVFQKVSINPFFGGYVARNISAITRLTYQGETQENSIKDDVRNWETGIVFGVNTLMKLQSFSVLIEIRYNIGMTNMVEEPYGIDFIKNSTLGILLGIEF